MRGLSNPGRTSPYYIFSMRNFDFVLVLFLFLLCFGGFSCYYLVLLVVVFWSAGCDDYDAPRKNLVSDMFEFCIFFFYLILFDHRLSKQKLSGQMYVRFPSIFPSSNAFDSLPHYLHFPSFIFFPGRLIIFLNTLP